MPHGAPDVLLRAVRPGLSRSDRAVHLRADLRRQGHRDGHRRAAQDRAAASRCALPDRRPDPPGGGQHEGESYRDGLERLVGELDLTEHVRFLDRFCHRRIALLLASTDLYLTPYRSREQIVSGALTFAVAAGCPVVSTPYFYAEDLLSYRRRGAGAVRRPGRDVRGRPGPARRSGRLARGPGGGAPDRLGSGLVAGRQHTLRVLREAVEPGAGPARSDRPARPAGIRAGPLLTLVDDVGIIQHADGAVPNRATGYCIDDVARLAMRRAPAALQGSDRADSDRGGWCAAVLAFLSHGFDPG